MMKLFRNRKFLFCLIVVVVIGLMFGMFFLVRSDDGNSLGDDTTTTTTTTTNVVKVVDVNSSSRPYAVMINNVDGARKLQSGLQDAYIVYEMMVEGGITRYLALFLDKNTERIGSIRSARHYYLDYALENDAIYVHHGYSPQSKVDWNNLGVDRIEVSDTYTGWRDKSVSKTYEYTLFTNIEKLEKGIGNKRVKRNNDLLLNYSADEIDLSSMDGAVVANNIDIRYSSGTRNKYIYDKDNKVYMRSVNDKEQLDYVTKEQLSVKNIIVYSVKYSNIVGDTSGRKTIDNIGSGEGYYISNGYAVPITWSKSSRSSQTIYKYKDGKEITVNDGNTFIQIQPSGQALNIA